MACSRYDWGPLIGTVPAVTDQDLPCSAMLASPACGICTRPKAASPLMPASSGGKKVVKGVGEGAGAGEMAGTIWARGSARWE